MQTWPSDIFFEVEVGTPRLQLPPVALFVICYVILRWMISLPDAGVIDGDQRRRLWLVVANGVGVASHM